VDNGSTILSIVGIIIAVLQTVMVLMLSNMKSTINGIWKRVNNHYHEVTCSNVDCRALKTGNVVIPGGSE
jgi:hypothetical protein